MNRNFLMLLILALMGTAAAKRFQPGDEVILERLPPAAEKALAGDSPVETARNKQFHHEFAAALQDLNEILAKDVGNAEALLVRAGIYQVQAEFAAAQKDCAQLLGLARSQELGVKAHLCLASVAVFSGRVEAALPLIDGVLQGAIRDADKAWAHRLKGEALLRSGQLLSAELELRQALKLAGTEATGMDILSSLLLEQGRAADVLALTENQKDLALGLRIDRVIAKGILGQSADDEKMSLAESFDFLKKRREGGHEREEARWRLHVLADAQAALAKARAGWVYQKEPEDARILLEAGLAAGDRAAVAEVRAFKEGTNLQDPALDRLLRKGLL